MAPLTPLASAGGVVAVSKRPLCFRVPPVVLALISPFGGREKKGSRPITRPSLSGTYKKFKLVITWPHKSWVRFPDPGGVTSELVSKITEFLLYGEAKKFGEDYLPGEKSPVG